MIRAIFVNNLVWFNKCISSQKYNLYSKDSLYIFDGSNGDCTFIKYTGPPIDLMLKFFEPYMYKYICKLYDLGYST